MKLETFYTQDDIAQLYNRVIIYSILKYQSLKEEAQEEFKPRFEHAIVQLKNRHIEPTQLQHTTLEGLKQELINEKSIYNNILEQNKEIINLTAPEIETILLKEFLSKETELEQLSYLFDFLAKYLTYPEEYYEYCLKVPPVDGFEFDFKNNIPADSSINGMLVMGQGFSDEISNLMIYLGNRLNLNITKQFCEYKGSLHSINIVTLQDGKKSLIDVTRLIRKDKTKEECFLVSAEDLNKNKDYQFKDTMPPTTTETRPIPNYQEKAMLLVQFINNINPFPRKLEETTNRKQYK